MQAIAWNTDWHSLERKLANNASPCMKHRWTLIWMNKWLNQLYVWFKVPKGYSPVTLTFTLTPLIVVIDPLWIQLYLTWANVLQCDTPTLQSLWNVIKRFVAWFKVPKGYSPVTLTFTLTPLIVVIDPLWIQLYLTWANVLQCDTPTLQSLWNVIKRFVAWYLALSAQINFLLSWLDSGFFFPKLSGSCHVNNTRRCCAVEFSRNTQSWQLWHFCRTSNGNELLIVTSRINFNANLHLTWCFESKFMSLTDNCIYLNFQI